LDLWESYANRSYADELGQADDDADPDPDPDAEADQTDVKGTKQADVDIAVSKAGVPMLPTIDLNNMPALPDLKQIIRAYIKAQYR
jgi:hypothetical protein